MIQFDTDGVTLFYIAADNSRVSHNFMDGQVYDDMLTILGAQKQAAKDNTKAVSDYTTSLATAQTNIGRPGFVMPVKPLQKVVADADGAVTMVPFSPALPDLVLPTVDPSSMSGIANPTVAAPPNKQDVMYNMILAMFRKMFPEA